MIGKELEEAQATRASTYKTWRKADASYHLAKGRQQIADLLVVEQLLEKLVLEYDLSLPKALEEISSARREAEASAYRDQRTST